MALTRDHAEFIESVISYLLDFPIQQQLLDKEVKKLQDAFSSPITENHDCYQIKEFLCSPTTTLRRLENCSSVSVNVGFVQSYILDLLTSAISTAAASANTSLQALAWDIEKLKSNMIPIQNYAIVFKTDTHLKPSRNRARRLVAGYLPWQDIFEEGKVFGGVIYRNKDEKYACVKINFLFPWSKTGDYRLFELIADPMRFNFEDEFFTSLIPTAKTFARETTTIHIYGELLERQLATSSTIIQAKLNKNINRVITHTFYLNLLLERKMDLTNFLSLTVSEARHLEHVIVKNALEHRLCDFETAKKLKTREAKVLGCYFSLVNKKFPLTDIIGITREQAQILTIPIVVNLIYKEEDEKDEKKPQEKLLFHVAKTIPLCVKQLFLSTLYMDFFYKNNIHWAQLPSLEDRHCQFLLNPRICEFVKDSVFEITDVAAFTQPLMDRLCKEQKNIKSLLVNNQMTLYDLRKLSEKDIALIDAHPAFWDWLRAGIIRPGEFDNHLNENIELPDLFLVFNVVFVLRLTAIKQNNPYLIQGNVLDNVTSILSELSQAAFLLEIDFKFLQEIVLRTLIQDILTTLQLAMTDGEENHSEQMMIATLIHKTGQHLNNDSSSMATFSWLIHHAEELSLKISQNKDNLTLFGLPHHSHHSFSNVRSIFLNILRIRDFVEREDLELTVEAARSGLRK